MRACVCLIALCGFQDDAKPLATAPLAEYFRDEVARITPLAGVTSREDWIAGRAERQRQMREMLGLWPTPKRTDLQARVTRVVERPDFFVENLVFQSMPGLYVTGNLYRPREIKEPLPAILYVCGHSPVEKDGVVYGNKAHYQHHAAWFAANGYVCLVIDTLQLGELSGLHHGMYREEKWWWQSRGYTPAGVEAWNGVRALDYLESRPEVDPTRIGVTGRSGGGATSWWLGAIDDRIAAVAPVAGITDLQDHVVNAEPTGHYTNGVLEGHCDCMYMCNTYRWDYDAVAALIAPRPLLIENTDADSIFPIAGVKRVHDQVAKVYGWYGVPDRVSLVVGTGGHADTPELRHAAFAFFEKWLKGREVAVADIEEPDRKVPVELLRVLQPGEVPPDCRNATIDETFIARAKEPDVPSNSDEWARLREQLMGDLSARVIRGWPADAEAGSLNVKLIDEKTREGVTIRRYEFDSQPGVRLPMWVLSGDRTGQAEVRVNVLGDREWDQPFDSATAIRPYGYGAAAWSLLRDRAPEDIQTLVKLAGELNKDGPRVFLVPRGVGPTAWPQEKETHLRRRFYLLGQTLDGMRAWDVKRGVAAYRSTFSDQTSARSPRIILGALHESAPVALFAAIPSPEIDMLFITDCPLDDAQSPVFLNLGRSFGLPQAAALMFPRELWIGHPYPHKSVKREPDPWRWLRSFKTKMDRSNSINLFNSDPTI